MYFNKKLYFCELRCDNIIRLVYMDMERNSSVELYRIIATFAVLVFHFNGWLVGGMPKYFDFENISAFRVSQAIIESFSCICVNMFLVISGYFGIKLKWQSVLRICLLLFSIHIPFYLIDCFYFNTPFLLKEFLRKFLVISNGGYFIQCYLMLMLFSPIINTFIEKYNKRKGALFVILIVIVEFWFDCITHSYFVGFINGYSVLHFTVVYMVARYVYIYRIELMKYKKGFWVRVYFICSILIFVLYVTHVNYVWQYSNPIIIISAICSFMPFVYKSFVNKWVNWVAKSTLSVYIIHVTVPFYNQLVKYDTYILDNYQYPVYLVFAIGGVLCVFVLSILYDKVRSLLTDPIYNYILSFVKNRE